MPCGLKLLLVKGLTLLYSAAGFPLSTAFLQVETQNALKIYLGDGLFDALGTGLGRCHAIEWLSTSGN